MANHEPDRALIRRGPSPLALTCGVLGVALLATASLVIGVGDMSLSALAAGTGHAELLLVTSRVPRTLALIFAGMSMGVCAVLMQMLFRNRFAEPTTAGTADAASLGLLVSTLIAPGLAPLAKMGVAALFALAGTALFLRITRRVAGRGTVLVPLTGLMLGGIISALTTFLAYRADLLQSLAAWVTGDFSGVLRGRYELMWLTAALAAIAYMAADRFTAAGLGEAFTRNLGLNYRRIEAFGLGIVALASAACIATAGTVPFLGLIVANTVGLILGDNLRQTMPWIALSGAAFLLTCDIVGRLIRFPYEIPVGTVAGVVGSAVFLYLLLGGRYRLG